jgi:hypothetical protein
METRSSSEKKKKKEQEEEAAAALASIKGIHENNDSDSDSDSDSDDEDDSDREGTQTALAGRGGGAKKKSPVKWTLPIIHAVLETSKYTHRHTMRTYKIPHPIKVVHTLTLIHTHSAEGGGDHNCIPPKRCEARCDNDYVRRPLLPAAVCEEKCATRQEGF